MTCLKRELPSPELLGKLLRYELDTGKLFWRERDRNMFSSDRDRKIWNTRYARREAFLTTNRDGYQTGRVLGKRYLAHRVIWAMVHGSWPHGEIDHINGSPADNRIENMRCVTRSENMRNASKRSNNKSGHNGVCWHKAAGKWRAQIGVNNERRLIGLYACVTSAMLARKRAEIGQRFTERHGT